MGYKVRIYAGENLYDLSLNEKKQISIGSALEDDCSIKDCGLYPHQLQFFYTNNRWIARVRNAEDGYRDIQVNDGSAFPLNKEQIVVAFVFAQNIYSARTVELGQKSKFRIGREKEECDLVLPERNISRNQAEIISKIDGQYLVDNSRYGTYVNYKKIHEPYKLSQNDVIQFGRYSIRYEEATLHINEISSDDIVKETYKYPHYYKPIPKLRGLLPDKKIQIQSPPAAMSAPEGSGLSGLVMPLVMIFSMILMMALSVFSIASLIFTLPMSVATIIMTLTSSKSQKKKYKEKEEQRQKKYQDYLIPIEKEIRYLKQEQLKTMQLNDPSFENCIQAIQNRKGDLWNSLPTDEDFLNVWLGLGTVPVSFEVSGQTDAFELEEDQLRNKMKKIIDSSKSIQSAPISCNIRREQFVGIIGERQDTLDFAQQMILELSARHSYLDLKLIVVHSNKEKREWAFVKWLPHVFSNDRSVRYLCSNHQNWDVLAEPILQELNGRNRAEERNANISPYYLFVLADMDVVGDSRVKQLIQTISTEKNRSGAGMLFLYDTFHNLPQECNSIIEIKNHSGELYSKKDIKNKIAFSFEHGKRISSEEIARSLAPVRLMWGQDHILPTNITFLEGYKVKTVEELELESRWEKSKTSDGMAVPIGIQGNGKPFMFNIVEESRGGYGPHGLIAGMTGSGKSEMIQSWILSMALKYTPNQVNFVLIDFKGTGLLYPFKNFPHLAGSISDLDSKIGRNLIALQNEIERRKRILDKYGEENILKYQDKYYEGIYKEPFPFLFVIIDEFAEFKVQFPDFMTVVESLFQTGRSLGIYIILMAQNPSGVISDKMNANVNFRWCLKVANVADSNEMLTHPDAARLTNPGRAFVRVGNDMIYELVQSYYSGATYNPEKEDKGNEELDVFVVKENGERISYLEQEKKKKGGKKEINAVVEYITEFANTHRYEKARQVWMPRMAYEIVLDTVLESWHEQNNSEIVNNEIRAVLGMVDDPEKQKQYPLEWNFTRDGHLAVFGAPVTGKTTLLQTAIMSLVQTYSPTELNIYIMDFGGWSLGIFKDYPQVGGIANDNDEVKIEKLVQMLQKSLNERKRKFSEVGVGNLTAYKQITGEEVPTIVLVLDNFAPVFDLYPDLDGFFLRLTQEGGNYGIYFLATASSQMNFGYKISQNIKGAIALNLTDATDYQSIVGKTNGLEPEDAPGRGLVKSAPPKEIQIALPAKGATDGERVLEIRNTAFAMKKKWNGTKAKAIPVMPDDIYFDTFESDEVVLGLSVQEVEPVCLPKDGRHYLPIIGTSGSGKTNMLLVLGKYAMREPGTSVLYLDAYRRNGFVRTSIPEFIYMDDIQDFDTYMEELSHELKRRKEILDKDKDAVFEKRVILMDGYRQAFDLMEDDTANRLNALVQLGMGLNVFLYISDDCDIFNQTSEHETIAKQIRKDNSAILLGGSFNDYLVFSSNLSSMESMQNVGHREGYFLWKGKATRIKTINFKE